MSDKDRTLPAPTTRLARAHADIEREWGGVLPLAEAVDMLRRTAEVDAEAAAYWTTMADQLEQALAMLRAGEDPAPQAQQRVQEGPG